MRLAVCTAIDAETQPCATLRLGDVEEILTTYRETRLNCASPRQSRAASQQPSISLRCDGAARSQGGTGGVTIVSKTAKLQQAL